MFQNLAVTVLAAALLLPLAPALKVSDELANPAVKKVVNMLKDMQKEIEKEAAAEKELFEKALCMCDGGEEQLKKVIAHNKGEIERLTSKIEADTAEKGKLAADLKAHKADVAQTEKALEEATGVREKEAKKYSDDEMMNRFSIDQITQALRLFEKAGSAASFVQANPNAKNFRRIIEVSRFISPSDREKVLEFLDEGSEQGAHQPPGVAGEMSSGVAQILGVLKGMKDEIIATNKEMKTEEEQAIRDFNSMKEAQLEKLGVLAKTISDKEKRSGDLALSLSADKDALDDAQDEFNNSTKYLASLDEECAKKRKMKDMREKMRADEIAAVGEAIAILTDDEARATLNAAHKPEVHIHGSVHHIAGHEATMLQDYEALMQVKHSVGKAKTVAAHKPNLLLAQQAKTVAKHTKTVAQTKAAAESEAPDATQFAGQAEKVVHFMINNMVEVLHNDDVNDEDKKIFCANETEAYYQLNLEKTRLSEELTARIDKMTGELKMTEADIKFLEEEIYTLDKEVSMATEMRKKEHTEFVNDFATMDTARRLIDKAANRLQQFYNPKQAEMKAAGKFETLLQTETQGLTPAAKQMAADLDFVQVASVTVQHGKSGSAVAPPEMVDTPEDFEKNSGGNSVIGLMNEIKGEMTLDMKEAETEEKYSAKDYVRQMKDAVEDRAAAVKALHEKMAHKAKLEEKILQDKELRVLTIKELEEIAIYQVQLHAECDFLLKNFDRRHSARVDEEVGLESAESIVTHETPPTHSEAEVKYEEEHSEKQVDEHFPELEMPAN